MGEEGPIGGAFMGEDTTGAVVFGIGCLRTGVGTGARGLGVTAVLSTGGGGTFGDEGAGERTTPTAPCV
jgi:hypothetical protein